MTKNYPNAAWDVTQADLSILPKNKMKMPEMNKVYVLNPYYHLRHDIHRVALFSTGTGAETGCSRNWHTFIHPLQAVMLSFFTYDRPLQETIPLLCDFFYRSRERSISPNGY